MLIELALLALLQVPPSGVVVDNDILWSRVGPAMTNAADYGTDSDDGPGWLYSWAKNIRCTTGNANAHVHDSQELYDMNIQAAGAKTGTELWKYNGSALAGHVSEALALRYDAAMEFPTPTGSGGQPRANGYLHVEVEFASTLAPATILTIDVNRGTSQSNAWDSWANSILDWLELDFNIPNHATVGWGTTNFGNELGRSPYGTAETWKMDPRIHIICMAGADGVPTNEVHSTCKVHPAAKVTGVVTLTE